MPNTTIGAALAVVRRQVGVCLDQVADDRVAQVAVDVEAGEDGLDDGGIHVPDSFSPDPLHSRCAVACA